MTKEDNKEKAEDSHIEGESEELICGIIMPIANSEGYPNGHWQDVYAILSEAASKAGFKPNLVSFDDDVAVIQKRIVQNIYSNPIVICDISNRNANVMFELGMRLAFDKPTIIVKDETTPYSFDISPIEHINYPADLRYKVINEFKEVLCNKIKDTYKKSNQDPNYTTFLKHYGSFEVVKIQEEEVGELKYILSQINELKAIVLDDKNKQISNWATKTQNVNSKAYIFPISFMPNADQMDLDEIIKKTEKFELDVISYKRINGKIHLTLASDTPSKLPDIKTLKNIINS